MKTKRNEYLNTLIEKTKKCKPDANYEFYSKIEDTLNQLQNTINTDTEFYKKRYKNYVVKNLFVNNKFNVFDGVNYLYKLQSNNKCVYDTLNYIKQVFYELYGINQYTLDKIMYEKKDDNKNEINKYFTNSNNEKLLLNIIYDENTKEYIVMTNVNLSTIEDIIFVVDTYFILSVLNIVYNYLLNKTKIFNYTITMPLLGVSVTSSGCGCGCGGGDINNAENKHSANAITKEKNIKFKIEPMQEKRYYDVDKDIKPYNVYLTYLEEPTRNYVKEIGMQDIIDIIELQKHLDLLEYVKNQEQAYENLARVISVANLHNADGKCEELCNFFRIKY